jgi:hypothetical protein
VTECNTISQPGHHAERRYSYAPENRDCSTGSRRLIAAFASVGNQRCGQASMSQGVHDVRRILVARNK